MASRLVSSLARSSSIYSGAAGLWQRSAGINVRLAQPHRAAILVSSSSSSWSSSWQQHQHRFMSSSSSSPPPAGSILGETKIVAPPMVYIAGEEMTHYACDIIRQQWLQPYFDMSQWQEFDLSCHARDATNDQVLLDAVQAGKAIGAIFKEPTITPNATQVKEMKLSKAWGSPNGAMRRGWNGITISRDTIHIGMFLFCFVFCFSLLDCTIIILLSVKQKLGTIFSHFFKYRFCCCC
jgi:hypothetical protein